LEPLDNVGDGLMIFVTDEEIVYLPTNGHQLTINHFVGNAGIIWVEDETNGAEVCNKFAIKQQSTFHHSIK
jgi:hypothetical protein